MRAEDWAAHALMSRAPRWVHLTAALVVGVWLSACGASALSTQARAAQITALSLRGAAEAADAGHQAAIQEAYDEGGMEAARAEHMRWLPVAHAIDVCREAVSSWVDSISLAQAAGEGEEIMLAVVGAAARAILSYDTVADALRSVGLEAPPLPDFVRALLQVAGSL